MARKTYIKPTPGNPALIPTKEEFETWCENPVTSFVALAYEKVAEAQKEGWINFTWDQNKVDKEIFVELKVRSDAYKAFIETEYANYFYIVVGEHYEEIKEEKKK